MRRPLLFTIVLLLTCVSLTQAQYDVRLSQYFQAKPYYNPASVGATEDLNILALARMEWVGIKGAPLSFFAMADMPLTLGKTQHGVGVVLLTESIGLFQNTHVGLQYAYKQKLFGGTISGGFQIGLVNQSFDGSKVEMVESEYHQQTDEAIPTSQVSGMGFDMNFGLFYTHKKFYAGIGMAHLIEPELQLGENAYSYIGRTYNFMGGYNIQLPNPLFELQPSVFLLTDLQSFHTDITARLEYNKMFNGITITVFRDLEKVVASISGISQSLADDGVAYPIDELPVFGVRDFGLVHPERVKRDPFRLGHQYPKRILVRGAHLERAALDQYHAIRRRLVVGGQAGAGNLSSGVTE